MSVRTLWYILALSLVVILFGAVWFVRNRGTASAGPDYPVKPVPFTAVHLTDEFWAPRIETNQRITIPAAMHQLRVSGRVDCIPAWRMSRRWKTMRSSAAGMVWRRLLPRQRHPVHSLGAWLHVCV